MGRSAVDQIKKDLTEAPVLAMPNTTGHIVLVSDTSKIACGSALYQEQKGRYGLIGYFSKKLPPPAQRYSISELELTGIYANVTALKHLLRNANSTLYCDHSALVHIMNGKREPPTLILKKLIENLSDYKFEIKFLRGKDMYISDFLSRHPDEEESCNDPIIPVVFLMKEVILPEHSPNSMEWLNVMLSHEELKVYREGKFKECQCDKVMRMNEQLIIMTRNMAKTANADVSSMYPLKGDHKKPEKSQIGITEAPGQNEQPEQDMSNKDKQSVNGNPMAEIDNINKPDVVRPKKQNRYIPQKIGNLQAPPVLNEPIPMKSIGKSKPMINYDTILAPVNIDVTLKGQLPPFYVEKNFEAIYNTAEKLPNLEDLFREDNLYLNQV